MLTSMTGFSTYQQSLEQGELIWELKTVNHRYLDISVRLPEPYRAYESTVREQVKKYILRGKVDFQLKLKEKGTKNNRLVINQDKLATVIEQVKLSSKLLDIDDKVTWDVLLMLPDMLVEIPSSPIDESDLSVGLNEVLTRLKDNRLIEGKYLQSILEERLNALLEYQRSCEMRVEGLACQVKSKLKSKLEEFQTSVSEDRLAQEVAILLTKMDVAEEVDRIKSHCQQVQSAMAMQEPVGRRLDFLMQELNREVNTLSVKVDDASLRKETVDMKVLIEQMREQVQNIE